MSKTGVPYADEALHAVRGCTKISRGCSHCYACTLAATRLSSNPKYCGLAAMSKRYDQDRPLGQRMVSVASWRDVRTYPEELRQPVQRREPKTWFVSDMGDLFHESVPFEFIAAVFGVMAATPRHTYLLLTKRPERMAEWFRWIEKAPVLGVRKTWPNLYCTMAAQDADYEFMVPNGRPRFGVIPEQPWPLQNVYPGTTVEGQRELEERAPHLLLVPVHPDAARWLSIEPQLENIDLLNVAWPGKGGHLVDVLRGGFWGPRGFTNHSDMPGQPGMISAVIQGCEKLSGGRTGRSFDWDWAISIQKQCMDAGAHYYLKQAPGRGGKVDELPQLYGRTWRELPWPKH